MQVLLKSLTYLERKGQPKEWTLEGLNLGPINLLVGRNATGKTRVMNVILNLARIFFSEPKIRLENSGYELLFEGKEQLRCIFEILDGKVEKEELYFREELKLTRGHGGEGEIVFASENGKKIRFKPPENELAAVARRDSLQHPFLEALHEWAIAVRHYTFGTSLGKESAAVFIKGGPDPDDRDSNQVIGIYRKAEKEFNSLFKEAVISDMAELHYNIEEIGAYPSTVIKVIAGTGAGDVHVLGINCTFRHLLTSDPDCLLKREDSPVKVKGWNPTHPATLTGRAIHDSTTQTTAPFQQFLDSLLAPGSTPLRTLPATLPRLVARPGTTDRHRLVSCRRHL
jgi:hypothetical protein